MTEPRRSTLLDLAALAAMDAPQPEALADVANAIHPAELAQALSGMDADVRDAVLAGLRPAKTAAVLGFIEPHFREGLLGDLEPREIARVLRNASDDVATDVLQSLPEEVGARVLEQMPPRVQQAISELAHHEPDSAGGRMSGQLVTVSKTDTLTDVLDYLRKQRPSVEEAFYVYVTDDDGRLEGVMNLRSLLIADPDAIVESVMTPAPIAVAVDEDQEEAARLLKRYNLLALPVVDAGGRLVGTITHDDSVDVLEQEATEDMFELVGVSADDDLRSVRRSVRFRLPWLTVNLVTLLAAGLVVAMFESTLERVAVLAVFLPVVAGQGANAGIQTVTVVVRSMALGRLTRADTLQLIAHEFLVGIFLGVSTGLVVAVIALAWQGNPALGLVVGLAMGGNVVFGVLAGVLIPVALDRLRSDPALSAGIWLTTFTDILGFAVYLGLATLLISQID